MTYSPNRHPQASTYDSTPHNSSKESVLQKINKRNEVLQHRGSAVPHNKMLLETETNNELQ